MLLSGIMITLSSYEHTADPRQHIISRIATLLKPQIEEQVANQIDPASQAQFVPAISDNLTRETFLGETGNSPLTEAQSLVALQTTRMLSGFFLAKMSAFKFTQTRSTLLDDLKKIKPVNITKIDINKRDEKFPNVTLEFGEVQNSWPQKFTLHYSCANNEPKLYKLTRATDKATSQYLGSLDIKLMNLEQTDLPNTTPKTWEETALDSEVVQALQKNGIADHVLQELQKK